MPRERSIVHLDADAFFASVEQASDPRLRGKPIAVGGEKRGIIASASYEARKFGIYTPMPTVLARRLCPKLVLVPGDFERYELFSRLMFSYAYDFTPDVEIGSIDEGYFDLSAVRKPPLQVAQTIRDAIAQSLRLPVSEGIGPNKLISQIASKLRKPHAFEFVPRGCETAFLHPLANKWLPGVGPKMGEQLDAAGLARIGQIAATPLELLGLITGSLAPQLKNFSRGIDERRVVPLCAPAKSYGEQETFAADTTDDEFIAATLRRMADKLMTKVRTDHKSIRTVTVKVRYNDMDEEQAGESLPEPTDLETDLYSLTTSLLRKAWSRRVSLRLVSLKLSNVYEGFGFNALALDAPSRQHEANERLAGVVDNLRRKFGRSAVFRGHDFILKERAAGSREFSPPADAASATEQELNEQPLPYGRLAAHRQTLGSSVAMKRPEEKVRCLGARIGAELQWRSALSNGATNRPQPTLRRVATYVPLQLHSYYSFLDSTLSVQSLVNLAAERNLPALALTDHQNLHGAIEFAQAATKAGIKPIIGTELKLGEDWVWLYVQDARGYRNLCRILNAVGLRPETSRPRQPPEFSPTSVLADRSEGLLAVSSNTALAQFFPGRFYQRIRSIDEYQSLSPTLPCIATFPVHYAAEADRWKYNVVQSIRTLTLLRQQHPEKRLAGDYHFRSGAEMRQLFGRYPALLDNSFELAERCSFAFSFGKPQFPPYQPEDGSSPAGFLKRLALEGLHRRYPATLSGSGAADRMSSSGASPRRVTARELRPQLEEELAIITEVGYEEYFLVMWDILQECRKRGIDWITRGSAADSLVCYCLGISGVCPIRFDLYFRRFLNKERMALNKLPDIDVDFPHDRKDDVIDLIFEKYGSEKTAVVGGFSTFQSRSAFAEVAKVLGVSEYQVRRITERLPHFSRASELAAAIAETQECRDLPLDQEPYASALKMAHCLDGFPRYAKMHPCGLVLSRQPMDEITPCFTSAKGYATTHFDMDAVEAVGLIKMDILAQGGLAVMRDVQTVIRDRSSERGTSSFDDKAAIALALDTLEPWEDPEVWRLIASGQARAVHHIESPAMVSLCKMCNVQDIDTLIAIVSVIRPGAANESKKMEFARRYQGLSPVHYPHPSVEPCLRSTYGLVVYEEHILQICEAFAGLPPGRADMLRRALGKDKTDLIEEIRLEFIECARKLGRDEALIQEVWELVVGFKGYAFCKAHSTAYGVEAYQAAWLKRYYPAEFMAAVLTNGKGFYSPLVYILECHRLGIPLLPPTINEPGPAFVVTNGKIRVPTTLVKGLSTGTTNRLLAERKREPFSSLTDFFLRVQPLGEEIQALIQIGAFDEFGQSRTRQFWEFKALAPIAREAPRAGAQGGDPRQLWLLPPANLDRLPTVPLAEPDRLKRLRWEEELLGYCVSGHPLELYPDIAWETYCPIDQLHLHIGQQIVTCGLVVEQRIFHQTTGEPMKFITIADRTGMIETELFARTYRFYGLNTVRYRVLEITATVEPFENGRGHTLRALRAGKPRKRA